MYIRFELTSTDMVFKVKDEAGTDIETFTYALDTYQADPSDKLGCTCDRIIVRKIGDPVNTWPPPASFPLNRMIFINTATLPFQTDNESSS